MSSFVLKIDNLFKQYRGATTPVWNGLNLEIRPGAIYGLLGPNGVGKTTLVKIITGLSSYGRGSVEVFGKKVKPHDDFFRKRIGVVPQEITLYDELSAKENLLFWGGITGLSGKKLRMRIAELMELFNLEKYGEKPVSTYSGGMRRCVNLIAGIMHHPEFLLLDEPTTGIDVQTKQLIRNNLLLLNEEGTTILYTSHDMAEAESLCSVIGIVKEGILLVEGSPAFLQQTYSQAGRLEDVYLNLIENDERI